MQTKITIDTVHHFILLIHVIAGITSLFSGVIAILATPKGNKLHRLAGILYFWCMSIIFLTSLLAILFFKFNGFLFGISILSFFTCFSGYRSLKRKKPNEVKWFDKFAAYLGVLAGISLFGYGVYAIIKHSNFGFASLCFVFGFLLTANSYKDIIHFQKSEYQKLWWWFHHLNMMMASFIASVTAALVNNIYKVVDFGAWNFVFWLLPTLILVPFIVRWNRYYRKKFNIQK